MRDDHEETARAREASDTYLAMGRERSLQTLHEQSQGTDSPYPLDTLKKWSAWFHWRARAAQWDHEQSELRRAELRNYIAEEQDCALRTRIGIARQLQEIGMHYIGKRSIEQLVQDLAATCMALLMVKEGLASERADLPTPLKGRDLTSDVNVLPERRYDAHEIEMFEATVLDVIGQEAPHVRETIEDALRSAFSHASPHVLAGEGRK